MIYKIFLCHKLANYGFNCYLGRKSYINYLLKTMKRYIYIDKGYHKGNSEKLYNIIKKNEGFIISLDEEGGVDYSDGSTLLERYSKILFNNANLTFMWGSKQLKHIENNIVNEKKIIVSGHPRFELLNKKYHYLYQHDVKKIKIKFKKFILINTNMGFGNNIRGDEFVRTNYRDRFKNLDNIIEFDKQKLNIYISLLKTIGKNQTNNIVLRPHPEEDHDVYYKALNKFNNIHITSEGSVIPWIIASDIMIHPDCTTGIEALFMGKKALSYLPHKYQKELVTTLPLEASECFTIEEEICKYINEKKYFNLEADLNLHPFSEDYFSISKKTTEIITNQIYKLYNNLVIDEKRKRSLFDKLKILLFTIKQCYLDKINDSELIFRKLNGFNSQNIKRINNLIAENSRDFKSIKFSKINNQLFHYYNTTKQL